MPSPRNVIWDAPLTFVAKSFCVIYGPSPSALRKTHLLLRGFCLSRGWLGQKIIFSIKWRFFAPLIERNGRVKVERVAGLVDIEFRGCVQLAEKITPVVLCLADGERMPPRRWRRWRRGWWWRWRGSDTVPVLPSTSSPLRHALCLPRNLFTVFPECRRSNLLLVVAARQCSRNTAGRVAARDSPGSAAVRRHLQYVLRGDSPLLASAFQRVLRAACGNGVHAEGVDGCPVAHNSRL